VKVTDRAGSAALSSLKTSVASWERSTSLVLELGAGDAGELQEGVNERAHALHAVAHAIDVVAAFIGELVGEVLLQREGEAVDGAQRGAKIVRDGVAEGFELLVGDGELAGAEFDALFEIGIEEGDLGGAVGKGAAAGTPRKGPCGR
jgi:hypothetical protein